YVGDSTVAVATCWRAGRRQTVKRLCSIHPTTERLSQYCPRSSSFFFSSRRRHTRSVSAFLLNRSSDLTSSTLYFDSLTVNAGNGGFLHCIQMDTSVNAANQVVSVGADIAFDADPKFFACLVRFESSSVPTTLPTAYDVYPL